MGNVFASSITVLVVVAKLIFNMKVENYAEEK